MEFSSDLICIFKLPVINKKNGINLILDGWYWCRNQKTDWQGGWCWFIKEWNDRVDPPQRSDEGSESLCRGEQTTIQVGFFILLNNKEL